MKKSCHQVKCSAPEMTASKYKTNADIELNNLLQKTWTFTLTDLPRPS